MSTAGLGHVVLSSARTAGWSSDSGHASLQVLTPAPADRTETVIAPHPDPNAVPLQRPRHLRDTPPVAPPPPLPLRLLVPHADWSRSGARLPPLETTTYWNPEDPRMPDGEAVVVALRAEWNPNSATLPQPTTARATKRVRWDPNDARLPPS